MALTDENGGGMVMPVAPMGNTGNGFGDCFGGSGWWILLLFILLGGNGWGNGFGGGFGGNDLYPWMNTAMSQAVQRLMCREDAASRLQWSMSAA